MIGNMFDNLKAVVANTRSEDIKMIDIAELHESDDNFFIVSRVEELAESIHGQGGIKENLIVRPLESGGYEIISGHRRRAAVQYLIDKGEDISHFLPCLIQNYDSEESKLLDLILMNTTARQLSDSELMQSYETINNILKEKKSLGEKFGKTREKLAEILAVSSAQVGKMQNVEKNAIEPIKEAVKNGNISISTANEIAKLDEESQKELASTSDLSEVKPKEIKKKKNTNKKESKKVDTSINLTETTESDDTFSFSDEYEEEVDTNINFSDNLDDKSDTLKTSVSDDEKVDTSINFSDSPDEDIKKWESAIKGYALLGAEQADFSEEQKNALLGGIIKALSIFGKADAEKKYNNR